MKNLLLFDGAFGTYIVSKGVKVEYPEAANISHPEDVIGIHREYISAGANAIKTNTFAASFALIPDRNELKKLITAGIGCARAAAGKDVTVFADLGPISGDSAADEYTFLADVFLKNGIKNFLFETQHEAECLKKAIAHIKSIEKGALVLASFAVGHDGYTQSGQFYTSLFDQAVDMGADIVGLNCICGPAHMLNLLSELPQGKYRLTAMPNAGYPTTVNGRTVYIDNPSYFADKLLSIYSLGVSAVGGCCGTTPEHIRCFAEKLRSASPVRIEPTYSPRSVSSTKKEEFTKPFIAVELPAPVNTDTSFLIAAAQTAKHAGANFVTIPDSPLAKSRANSVMTAAMVQRQAGIDAIPHMNCRDKNRIALKGDLMAGNIDGISRVLALTGDPLPETERGNVNNALGFNSCRLIEFIKSLNEVIFGESPYTICAALNINAKNFDAEVKRAEKKIASGAVCLFTQPAFSQESLENYFKAKERLNCKIAVGVPLIAGYKNALFLKNEVPGIYIPDSLIESLCDKDAEQTKEICVRYAKDMIDSLAGCDGYYIMTPLKKIDYSVALVQYIREITK